MAFNLGALTGGFSRGMRDYSQLWRQTEDQNEERRVRDAKQDALGIYSEGPKTVNQDASGLSQQGQQMYDETSEFFTADAAANTWGADETTAFNTAREEQNKLFEGGGGDVKSYEAHNQYRKNVLKAFADIGDPALMISMEKHLDGEMTRKAMETAAAGLAAADAGDLAGAVEALNKIEHTVDDGKSFLWSTKKGPNGNDVMMAIAIDEKTGKPVEGAEPRMFTADTIKPVLNALKSTPEAYTKYKNAEEKLAIDRKKADAQIKMWEAKANAAGADSAGIKQLPGLYRELNAAMLAQDKATALMIIRDLENITGESYKDIITGFDEGGEKGGKKDRTPTKDQFKALAASFGGGEGGALSAAPGTPGYQPFAQATTLLALIGPTADLIKEATPDAWKSGGEALGRAVHDMTSGDPRKSALPAPIAKQGPQGVIQRDTRKPTGLTPDELSAEPPPDTTPRAGPAAAPPARPPASALPPDFVNGASITRPAQVPTSPEQSAQTRQMVEQGLQFAQTRGVPPAQALTDMYRAAKHPNQRAVIQQMAEELGIPIG